MRHTLNGLFSHCPLRLQSQMHGAVGDKGSQQTILLIAMGLDRESVCRVWDMRELILQISLAVIGVSLLGEVSWLNVLLRLCFICVLGGRSEDIVACMVVWGCLLVSLCMQMYVCEVLECALRQRYCTSLSSPSSPSHSPVFTKPPLPPQTLSY